MKPAVKRTVSLLVSALVLIAAVVGYVILVKPAYREILQLRGVLKSKSDFFNEQSLAIGKVDNMILQYQGASKLQDTVSLSFPLKEDLASLFNQLRTLAELSGLRIEIFGVKPLSFQSLVAAPLIKNVGTLQVSLRVTGSYEAFKQFLGGLETNVRLMNVQQITIERLGSAAANLFSYNLLVNTYYQSSE